MDSSPSLPPYVEKSQDEGCFQEERTSLLPTSYNNNDNNNNNNNNSKKHSLIRKDNLEDLKSTAPAYIPSFEGLRGLSVLAVQLSHVIPIEMHGTHRTFGAMGMSTFFIMSGYLVTGSLIGQQIKVQSKTGSRFGHLPMSYRNRFARLWPAMFVVVISSAIIQYKLTKGRMPKGWTNNMANALLFVGNFEPFHSYTKSIWKHTYSMAIQEQWVVLWSLCLPILLSKSRRTRNTFMILVILFSYLGQSSWSLGLIHSSLFDTFGFFTWIGKLQLGAFLRLNPIPRVFHSKWSAWAGIVMFCFAVLESLSKTDEKLDKYGLSRRYLGKGMNYPYIALIISLFLIGGSIKGIWLFETKGLRFMGRVSYSWFLFQIPLLEVIGWPRGYLAVCVSCLAYVMATISTLYIEEPIRDWNIARVKARTTSKPK